MDYTKVLGNSNELKCIIAFMQLGYECSIPYGDGAKYDFIVDIDGHLYKIQCKCSRYVKNQGVIDYNAFCFSTTCQTVNTKEIIRHSYTNKEIDYFATSFNDMVYIVPVNECSTSKTLRLKPPSNNSNIYNKAEDYLITNIFSADKNFITSKNNFLERIDNNGIKKHLCPICGKEVTKEGNLCVECARQKSRKVDRPSREELKDLIRKDSFIKIGEKYNVTDSAVKKWCISYKLPSKKNEIRFIDNITWQNI